jgi:ABC-2 type transport system permease protein
VFYNGLFASGITVAVLAVVVLINLIVQALPSKYTEFDLSEAGLYTLSDSSVELTRTLEQDVTVYYLCETGSEDAIVTRLLDRYAAESSHLTWQQKDPAIYPTFAAQYDAKTASTGSLILVAENGRSTVIDASELYEYDYSNYYYTGSYDVQFDGEQQITSAIYRLTSGDESHAYAITNHGEAALSATLTSALEAQNIAVEEISLLNSTIPEDCDLLIINTPTASWTRWTNCVRTCKTAAKCSFSPMRASIRPIWTRCWRSSAWSAWRAWCWRATRITASTATITI